MKSHHPLIDSALMPSSGVQYIFFHTQGQEWRCLELVGETNAQSKYQKGEFFSLYQIPSLLRLLCIKNNCVSEQLAEQMYRSQETEQMCRIIGWRQLDRKIVVAQWLRQKTPEDLIRVQQFMQEQKKIEHLFQQLLAGGS